eukprot:gnl/TRDRNA2_/TRDRNA2_38149_c0_seq1.p1 gnl/TRDRNA2_/TRDRNA2_38149_c0~~gnl/TRDRNA2_/TRDRNA2_38149_c0_seq1.p1  ORF type:complete len:397 (+),score=29.54 gnl/TRDRNA2_/TRDRNA2_38149_c0_seq1:87-1277(+)
MVVRSFAIVAVLLVWTVDSERHLRQEAIWPTLMAETRTAHDRNTESLPRISTVVLSMCAAAVFLSLAYLACCMSESSDEENGAKPPSFGVVYGTMPKEQQQSPRHRQLVPQQFPLPRKPRRSIRSLSAPRSGPREHSQEVQQHSRSFSRSSTLTASTAASVPRVPRLVLPPRGSTPIPMPSPLTVPTHTSEYYIGSLPVQRSTSTPRRSSSLTPALSSYHVPTSKATSTVLPPTSIPTPQALRLQPPPRLKSLPMPPDQEQLYDASLPKSLPMPHLEPLYDASLPKSLPMPHLEPLYDASLPKSLPMSPPFVGLVVPRQQERPRQEPLQNKEQQDVERRSGGSTFNTSTSLAEHLANRSAGSRNDDLSDVRHERITNIGHIEYAYDVGERAAHTML